VPSSSAASLAGLWRRLSPIVGLALFAAALIVLNRELRQMSPHQLAVAMRGFQPSALVLAGVLTVLNYLILTGYDQLAFLYIRKRVAKWMVAMASFVGYAIANNVGFAMLSGTSARYRFYSRWGLTGLEVSRVVLFYSGTFWLGLLVLGGWSLLVQPLSGTEHLADPRLVRATGVVLLVTAAAYPVVALLRRRPICFGAIEVPIPSVPLVLAQFILSTLDWILAAGILYVLLPEGRPDFLAVLSAFLASQLVALTSHVPGGIGVFESLMILLLKGWLPAAELLPALAMFRVFYYLLPLVAALAVLLVDEFYHRRHHVVQWGNAFGTLTESLAPKLFAVFTMLAGAVLMLSGAVPSSSARMAWLATYVPLPVVEAAHFASSMGGFALLVASWGLARRLRPAYALAVAGLAIGIGTSLFRGAEYEEAGVMAALLVVLVLNRGEFHRRAPLFAVPLPPPWLTSAVAVVVASIGLGLFAFRKVDLEPDHLWRFAYENDVGRFLRASVGVVAALLAVVVRQWLRPPTAGAPRPDEGDLLDATRVMMHGAPAYASLVYLRDKSVLWNGQRSSFLMYGVVDRTWVALRDPLGPRAEAEGLVQAFVDRCDDYQAVPVFHEASRDWLACYADYGLTHIVLGDEARVFLPHFSPEAGGFRPLRQALRKLAGEGLTFDVMEPRAVSRHIGELADVSTSWLADKGIRERGFSRGFFDREYVARFPVATMTQGGRIQAFAVLWPTPDGSEVASDLVRHRRALPSRVLEGLFGHLLVWARERNYTWFDLGMVPAAGLAQATAAPLWSRFGRRMARHGDAFASAKALRAFKNRFDPVWEPRYLVYPGGLPLPRVLDAVGRLVTNGGS
jgi:phosphatidylglycerol lysyltransferase